MVDQFEKSDIVLKGWQLDFIKIYLLNPKPYTLLVSRVGTGKTITSLYLAIQFKKQHYVIGNFNHNITLSNEWEKLSNNIGVKTSHNIEEFTNGIHDGFSINVDSISELARNKLLSLSLNNNLFCIIDESHLITRNTMNLVEVLHNTNPMNKFLFISGNIPSYNESVDLQYLFDDEYIFDNTIIKTNTIRNCIYHYSPSNELLHKIMQSQIKVDDLTWREFEILISTMLEKDGYKVELTRGTKDGGIDILAIKDLKELGLFKALWQAKKYSIENKVGLSIVRELADTRQEIKANKGIIVTTSYLTKGAKERIKREKYLLGKVDRDDLINWIDRILFKIE